MRKSFRTYQDMGKLATYFIKRYCGPTEQSKCQRMQKDSQRTGQHQNNLPKGIQYINSLLKGGMTS